MIIFVEWRWFDQCSWRCCDANHFYWTLHIFSLHHYILHRSLCIWKQYVGFCFWYLKSWILVLSSNWSGGMWGLPYFIWKEILLENNDIVIHGLPRQCNYIFGSVRLTNYIYEMWMVMTILLCTNYASIQLYFVIVEKLTV